MLPTPHVNQASHPLLDFGALPLAGKSAEMDVHLKCTPNPHRLENLRKPLLRTPEPCRPRDRDEKRPLRFRVYRLDQPLPV